MKLKTFNLLVKFMELTFSENDNEALASLRMANKLLAADGITWERVFKRLVSIDVEAAEPDDAPVGLRQAQPRRQPATVASGTATQDYIKELFDVVYEKSLSDSAMDFVDSLHSQFLESKSLSPKQLEALQKFAEPVGYR